MGDSGNFGKMLMFVGAAVVLVGALIFFSKSFKGFPFGKLPGDIQIEREGVFISIPVTSMILLSLLMSAIFFVYRWFSK